VDNRLRIPFVKGTAGKVAGLEATVVNKAETYCNVWVAVESRVDLVLTGEGALSSSLGWAEVRFPVDLYLMTSDFKNDIQSSLTSVNGPITCPYKGLNMVSKKLYCGW
jgi:hypothetical protein